VVSDPSTVVEAMEATLVAEGTRPPMMTNDSSDVWEELKNAVEEEEKAKQEE